MKNNKISEMSWEELVNLNDGKSCNDIIMKDQVFSVKSGEWKVRLGGRVLPAEWNSRGAALAGLAVEKRRAARRTARRTARQTARRAAQIIVYKVVRPMMRGEFASSYRDNHYRVIYQLNQYVTAPIGKLFVFNTLERALSYAKESSFYNDLSILKCETAETPEEIETVVYAGNLSTPDTERILKSFWGESETGVLPHYLTIAPPGAYVVRGLTPLEVVNS